jgi:hypothetical protein
VAHLSLHIPTDTACQGLKPMSQHSTLLNFNITRV